MQELLWIKRAGEALSPTEAYYLTLVYDYLGKRAPKELSERAAQMDDGTFDEQYNEQAD